jgi:glutathione synthase/RimK-type ligase-like ATP-grasp enzyme
MTKKQKRPKLGLLYMDYVMQFFNKSNFKGWPDKIETVTYHWKNDKQRFINDVKAKKIDVLIGNVPATAYETFREIANALPEVRFVPSLDTQFSNKSKENVTRFCKKYDIPIPPTNIFYDRKKADSFLKKTSYPKIIKKSYGPSNYGGYFVHKVDSFKEATNLLDSKKYNPVYVQDFIPMSADIRVMLIGHKPACAFWRRPPEGEWLTNTSQGGSMDYQNVPKEVLDLAVKVSKAAKAEYWACDIAVGKDGKYRILECATAFAAFPYIRDWIGQYLMWLFSNGQFKKPNIPINNWEQLGKIDSSLLRTMRQITFGKYTPSSDADCFASIKTPDAAEMLLINDNDEQEEWPSDTWNFQDNIGRKKNITNKNITKKASNTESVVSTHQEETNKVSIHTAKSITTTLADDTYRYTLSRTWDEKKPSIMFIALHPSTADADHDDALIKKCSAYAKHWGYGGIIIGNLFAYRANNIAELKECTDPVGAYNNASLSDSSKQADQVIAIWGNDGAFKGRSDEVKKLLPQLMCLRLTAKKQPRSIKGLADDISAIPYN